jgi:ATP-dependent 26S proteasome regulatory subunit
MMNEKNIFIYIYICIFKGVCTEAGMYALRERRVHVTQEDFELAVAKVKSLIFE